MDVAHLLASGDISSINFEGNLYGAPYGSTFSAPQTMAEALKKAGVDLVQMANSFSINRGIAGLTASIDAIRAAGMEPLGVYATNEEFKAGKGYVIRNVRGVKMAFVAFTKGMDGMALPPGSENCVNVLYEDYDSAYQTVDSEKITSILSAAKKEKPDIIVALLHWGSEYNDAISKSQNEIVSLLQRNGVDAIIGTHSHYVQKMSYNAETGQFVAYSLGDFFSDAARAGSEYSVVLDLEITKDNATGKAKITGYSCTPIFTVHEEEKPLKVVRIAEAVQAYKDGHLGKVSAATYEKMLYALDRIAARIAGQ
jgi:poly-gamma-glutamate synthesis protein (capsule biosynthesis protein)